MGLPRKTVITITTDGSGNATVYSDKFSGRIEAAIVAVGSLTTGFDFVLSTETTLQTFLTETGPGDAEVFYPRSYTHLAADGAIGTAAAALLQTGIPVVNERVKCVVANGGVSKTGTITIIFDGVFP